MRPLTRAAIVAALMALALPFIAADAAAQDPDGKSAEPSPWRLGIALGYGERSNPLALSEDIPILVDLDIAWFGERFFFDNGDLGFTFADNRLVTASFVARVNSDRVFFGRTDTRFVNVSLAGETLAIAVELTIRIATMPSRPASSCSRAAAGATCRPRRIAT